MIINSTCVDLVVTVRQQKAMTQKWNFLYEGVISSTYRNG